MDTDTATPTAPCRLDKWLWAARFFKTRRLAVEAIDGGKVTVNGDRAKPARTLRPGDEVRVRLGLYEHVVTVRALSDRRGPAREAGLLYEETAASRAARERRALQVKAAMPGVRQDSGRPDKKQRRAIRRLKEG